MFVLAGMNIGDVTLLTGYEVKKFVSVVGRIDEECVKVESQDGEGWEF